MSSLLWGTSTSLVAPVLACTGLRQLPRHFHISRHLFEQQQTGGQQQQLSRTAEVGRLNHVAIAVPDLHKAAARYRDVLGAKVGCVVQQAVLFCKQPYCTPSLFVHKPGLRCMPAMCALYSCPWCFGLWCFPVVHWQVHAPAKSERISHRSAGIPHAARPCNVKQVSAAVV